MSAVRALSLHVTPSPADLPASPPPALDAAIDAALARAESLAAGGRELHFAVDRDGELRVQVRDLGGAVLRDVAPAEAWAIAGGLAGA